MDKPRRFSDLRKRADKPQDNVVERAAQAFHVVSFSEHGDAIKDFLSWEVFNVTPAADAGAWAEKEARRKFAAEILNMMDGKYERPSG